MTYFWVGQSNIRTTFHDKTGSKREIETTHSKIDSVRCLIFTWAGAQILSDLMHSAYPAISPTTGSLYHSPSPPGCLPHVCWLYDNKNRDFVSFPTLDYLNCNPRQWICFMAERETWGGGGCQRRDTECRRGWGRFLGRQSRPRRISRAFCRQTESLRSIRPFRWKPHNSSSNWRSLCRCRVWERFSILGLLFSQLIDSLCGLENA